MIFESHAHYTDDAFDADREALLGSLQDSGIGKVIDVGASLSSTKEAIALAEKYDYVYAAAGVHPSEVGDLNEETFTWLSAQCNHTKVVAVGEIGLDYHYPDDPEKDVQKYWFRKQLQLANEKQLPVIIHSREAAQDTLICMQEEAAINKGGVIHCYSYSKEQAKTYLDMGYHIGVGGVVTFKNGRKLRETVEIVPLERILIETDCPYLAPEPFRGKRNSSLYLPYVVSAIAEIKGVSSQEVEEVTYENARKLFDLT